MEAVLLRYYGHVLTAKSRLRALSARKGWSEALIDLMCDVLDMIPFSPEFVAKIVYCCDQILEDQEPDLQSAELRDLKEVFGCCSIFDGVPEGFGVIDEERVLGLSLGEIEESDGAVLVSV